MRNCFILALPAAKYALSVHLQSRASSLRPRNPPYWYSPQGTLSAIIGGLPWEELH